MSISKKLKGIQIKLLEIIKCPDKCQVCQEKYFEKNSQIVPLMSKV